MDLAGPVAALTLLLGGGCARVVEVEVDRLLDAHHVRGIVAVEARILPFRGELGLPSSDADDRCRERHRQQDAAADAAGPSRRQNSPSSGTESARMPAGSSCASPLWQLMQVLPFDKAVEVELPGLLALEREIPGAFGVAVAAGPRVVLAHLVPGALRHAHAVRLVPLRRGDRAGEVVVDLAHGTHLAQHLRPELARNVAVPASGGHPGRVGVVRRPLELSVGVLGDLVARDAEFQRCWSSPSDARSRTPPPRRAGVPRRAACPAHSDWSGNAASARVLERTTARPSLDCRPRQMPHRGGRNLAQVGGLRDW